MSLSADDLYTLENWFCELKLYEKDTDKYVELRNKIYTYIYGKLSDLMRTKTGEWARKYYLKPEDSQSIFSDALLACVEKYTPKRTKFITYFWTACENSAKNYYKHYRRMFRIPPGSLVSVDFTRLLDDDNTSHENMFGTDILAHISNLYDSDVDRQEQREEISHALEILQKNLTKTEKFVLEQMLSGVTLTQISQELGLTLAKVITHTRRIRKKAQKILQ